MTQDAIVMLREDHDEVRELFREFQESSTTTARRGTLVEQVIERLTTHTPSCDEEMCPRVWALLPGLQKDVIESDEEHHIADVLLMELVATTGKDERFDTEATVLIENVEHRIPQEQLPPPRTKDTVTR